MLRYANIPEEQLQLTSFEMEQTTFWSRDRSIAIFNSDKALRIEVHKA